MAHSGRSGRMRRSSWFAECISHRATSSGREASATTAVHTRPGRMAPNLARAFEGLETETSNYPKNYRVG